MKDLAVAFISVLIAFATVALPGDMPCSPCKPDDNLFRVTRNFEGLRLFSYEDVAGNRTIGFGHLILPGERFNEPLTGPQAEALLEKDEGRAAFFVVDEIDDPITQGQYDALTDFTFNLGPVSLDKLLDRVYDNPGHEAEQFMLYDKAHVNGHLVTLKGLFSRRHAESNLYTGK